MEYVEIDKLRILINIGYKGIKQDKYKESIEEYRKGKVTHLVGVNSDGIVVEGYTSLLAAMALGLKEVPYKRASKSINSSRTMGVTELDIPKFKQYIAERELNADNRIKSNKKVRLTELKLPDFVTSKYFDLNREELNQAIVLYTRRNILKPILIDSDCVIISGISEYAIALIAGITEVSVTMVDIRLIDLGIRGYDDNRYVDIKNNCGNNYERILSGGQVYSNNITRRLDKQNRHCGICGREITIDRLKSIKDGTDLAVETYKTPIRLGGKNKTDNKILVCRRCAKLKGELVYSEDLCKVIKANRELEDKLGIKD